MYKWTSASILYSGSVERSKLDTSTFTYLMYVNVYIRLIFLAPENGILLYIKWKDVD